MLILPPRVGFPGARRPPAWVRRLCCGAGWHYWVWAAPAEANSVALWEECGDCDKPVGL